MWEGVQVAQNYTTWVLNSEIYSSENKVLVDFTQMKKVDAEIEIYNIIGQQLVKEKFGKSTIYSRAITNLEAAYVIVRVKQGEEIVTKKVFIGN